jgi:small subunit ribosomal protein S21
MLIGLRHHLNVLSAQVTIFWPTIRPNMESTLILVTVRENEPFEKALRRFRRKVEREGIRKDIKKNSFYLKPGEKRRLKQRLAEKRRRKAVRRAYKRR